jgi:hypothetical protein
MGVKEVRVEFADTHEAIFYHPITPADIDFALASLSPRPPDSIGKQGAKRSGVGSDVGFSTKEMAKVISWRTGKIQLIVNGSDSSKHRGAITKDVRGRIIEMSTEPATKVGTVSASISEHHVVGE